MSMTEDVLPSKWETILPPVRVTAFLRVEFISSDIYDKEGSSSSLEGWIMPF
jgi:hypothetical protein